MDIVNGIVSLVTGYVGLIVAAWQASLFDGIAATAVLVILPLSLVAGAVGASVDQRTGGRAPDTTHAPSTRLAPPPPPQAMGQGVKDHAFQQNQARRAEQRRSRR